MPAAIKQLKNLARHLYHNIKLKRAERTPGSTQRPIAELKTFLEDIKHRGFKPKGAIDVGAHSGHWTKLAKSIFPETQFLMIEPLEETKASLQKMSKEDNSIEYIQAGAASQPGELLQTVWDDLTGSSFFPEKNEEKIKKGIQRITPVVTIDGLLNERKSFHPDFVKLDVQGFELEVLKGAESLFGKTQLFILETFLYQFEKTSPTTIEIFNFMAQRGYEFYDVTEYLRRPLDGAIAQIDIAFVLEGSTLRSSHAWE